MITHLQQHQSRELEMVVIEAVPTEVKLEPKPTTRGGVESSICEEDKATTAAEYVSDGFETASESDIVNDHQDEAENNHAGNQSVPPADHSYQDSLNDDQLKQKALEDASDAKLEGNKLFGDAQYEEALLKYDLALQLASEIPSTAELRSICHSNRATCFFKMGNYEDSIKECTKALDLNPSYMKALLRRADAHEKLEHYEEAVADMTKIVDMDPLNHQAKRSILRLEPLAREKREKMKEEMMGKLKEMGNSILGKFGMSVDNFKAVQDPNTGSYSISFQR